MSRRGTRRNPIPPGGEDVRAKRVTASAVVIAVAAPVKAVSVEDFGRDKDLKNLLRTFSQMPLQGMEKTHPKS